MSGERNRRSLAFRGGGLAVTGSSGVGSSNSNSWEAQAWQDRHLNGNRPEQEEDRDLGAKGTSLGRVKGGGSMSDSTEPEAEEEEDPEGGNWGAGDGEDDRVGGVGWMSLTAREERSREGCSWTDGNGLNSEDGAGLGSGGMTQQSRRRSRPGSWTAAEMEDYRNKPNENSYCYQLLQELNKQRKSGILCDVNIVVSGQVFRAHKNILVAGSRYFKTLYCLTKNESCDQTTITHLDVAAVQGFSVILDFLYSGNLLLTSQNAIEVMSVASYLQMTEVVQSCRAFIKDALNISIKQEAPDSVVVDYNKRRTVARDSKGSDKKPSNFWATSILSKLSIKASGSIKEEPSDVEVSAGEGCPLGSSGWGGDNSSESAENEPQGRRFVWNDTGAASAKKEARQEPGSGRRKKQVTRRFVYNIPPEPEEGFDEGMFIQPSASYSREDFSFLSENAELANQIQYSLFQDPQQGETWENGEASDTALNKLKCPHCNYIAKHRRTLKRHLIIHSGVRSFSCDICGKLFTRREHVKRHSLVHKKDKKYKCMVCKKIFMLAASVGIRHGSRRYGVCVDCADCHQGSQEGLDAMQDLDFSREDDFEETGEGDEDLAEEGEEPNEIDQSNWEEGDASTVGAALDED
ncbi:hypothetical protein AAFF_G00359240 [Aldrovandia affinis]|uniref:Zinc finger and BTB domain-containing protein 10 n=1 Tax=Aldrovandia affinis TaxID=143900 RepID=A0AAD7SIN1_9TELE|nr:hypothetical protein AAFF_G00359240 [Aldrovandia affinis]